MEVNTNKPDRIFAKSLELIQERHIGYCSDDETYKRIVLDAKKQSEKPKNPHGRGPAVATIQKQRDQAVPQMQYSYILLLFPCYS